MGIGSKRELDESMGQCYDDCGDDIRESTIH